MLLLANDKAFQNRLLIPFLSVMNYDQCSTHHGYPEAPICRCEWQVLYQRVDNLNEQHGPNRHDHEAEHE